MPDETLHLPLIQSVLEREKDTPGALLPILHAIQDRLGFIPAASASRAAFSASRCFSICSSSVVEIELEIRPETDAECDQGAGEAARIAKAVSGQNVSESQPGVSDCILKQSTTSPSRSISGVAHVLAR